MTRRSVPTVALAICFQRLKVSIALFHSGAVTVQHTRHAQDMVDSPGQHQAADQGCCMPFDK